MAESKDTPINVSAKNPVCNLCCAAKEKRFTKLVQRKNLCRKKNFCAEYA